MDWGSISEWSSDLGDGDWGSDLSDGGVLSVNDGVESVDWISGVRYGSEGTVWIGNGVRSSDDITVSAFLVGL